MVEIANNGVAAPLEGAIITMAGKTAVTDSRGVFQIEHVTTGVHKAEVSIPLGSMKEISTANKAKNLQSSVRVWSGEVHVSRGRTTKISISPLVELLRCGSEHWQLAFYATPPAGRSIIEGHVSKPNGDKCALEEHFLPQWHSWWNVYEPEPGYYELTVVLDNQSKESVGIYLSEDIFRDIECPVLIHPEDYVELTSPTPFLEYEVPDGSETVYVRIRDIETSEEVWIEGRSATDIHIPEGLLTRGKRYGWMVHVVNRPAVLPWIESLSEARFFRVSKDI